MLSTWIIACHEFQEASFPKLWGTILGATNSKDHSISGVYIWGSLIFENWLVALFLAAFLLQAGKAISK